MTRTKSAGSSRSNTLARTSAFAIALTLLTAIPADAQIISSANCIVTPANAPKPMDVCQKVSDLFRFLAPQIGVALAGGNPMMGEGSTVGGFGHASISVHANGVDGAVPKQSVAVKITGNAVASDFGAQRALVPMPSADAAVGLYKGIPKGLTNMGGVDLLIGATYIPTIDREPVKLSTVGDNYAIAYGLRVGILQESSVIPGVSVSFKRKKLPTTTFSYASGNDTLTVDGLSTVAKSYRIVASKRIPYFGFAGGVGRDVIDSKSSFSAVGNEAGAPVPRVAVSVTGQEQSVTRTNAFVDFSLGLPAFQFSIELGVSGSGDTQSTVNSFGGKDANGVYRYASIGIGARF